MTSAAKKQATYQDLLSVPRHLVAEIIHGSLITLPRPRSLHARASSTLGEELGPPFNRGRGGPGGRIILDEPELHLAAHILVPELAGWRRERMPELTDAAYFTIAPNWVCEVLSASTEAIDRGDKLPIYAAHQVEHVWLVDPLLKTLEIFKLDGPTYRLLKTWRDDDRVRSEPFEAVEIELGVLWQR